MMLATLLFAAGVAGPQVVTDMSFKETPEPAIKSPSVFPDEKRINAKREQQKPLFVEPVKPVQGYGAAEPVQWKNYGDIKINVASGAVKVQMKPGRLEPQLKKIAEHIDGIQADPEGNWFLWQASPHYRWPNKAEIHEPSVKHLVDALAASANLNIDITKQGMVIVYE
ncbi:hypothetical protein [Haliea sp.]|mgnify:CR=1 FL=1|jgi:hypothetical protein|uniref:hypothetical protein n=1 Tax=Haliea sp. TaxID=1932666 RepID=UPI000C6489B9|nr:hypothetical protein [Haliea sp.]MAD65702.1 hypothetical protein [Haliea sp.]|tara:strand:+ start:35127 stop:35630 length:504 start_codon:yes stop_codon:yes gene_type:complete